MSELMSEALNLMLVGMGFVFVFLTILVGVTSAMSALVLKYAPEPEPKSGTTTPAANLPPEQDAQLMAVLSAAVKKYRSDHKK